MWKVSSGDALYEVELVPGRLDLVMKKINKVLMYGDDV